MSDKQETVLSVKHVSKDFYLPHEKQNSIKSAIVNIFQHKDKEADTQHALKDISFDIKKGEFFGILGRNGSGKSTMLKIIAEIYQPTSGSVTHTGKLVPFIELGVGFNPELTGRENVYLNGALLGFSRKEIDARYDDIVAFAELEEFMDQKLKNYSSGMQVRLAFSVATHAEADILVVDEVLAVGDADFQRKCYDYFKSLKKTGKTVVFVTHDMGAANEYCDRAILIENGRIVSEGETYSVTSDYLKLFNTKKGFNENNNRWGSGEITFGAVSHKLTSKTISLSTEVQNNTSKAFIDCVDLLLDFYFDRKLVTGNSYKLLHNGKGFSLDANQKKKIELVFPNNFSTDTFDISMTLKTQDDTQISEAWENVIRFTNTYGNSKKYKIALPPEKINGV